MVFSQERLVELSCYFQNAFAASGMSNIHAILLGALINSAIVAIVLFVLDRFLRWAIVEGFRALTVKSKNTFDDYLLKTYFPRYVAHIIPIILLKLALPFLVFDFPETLGFFTTIVNIYVIFLAVRAGVLCVQCTDVSIEDSQDSLKSINRAKILNIRSEKWLFTFGRGHIFLC